MPNDMSAIANAREAAKTVDTASWDSDEYENARAYIGKIIKIY